MTLFEPHRLGDIDLNNRIVMAPMTRSRAGQDDEPTPLAIDYYSQRASDGGLIITEAVPISPEGTGFVSVSTYIASNKHMYSTGSYRCYCSTFYILLASSF